MDGTDSMWRGFVPDTVGSVDWNSSVAQSWAWIGSIHGLDWIGWDDYMTPCFKLKLVQHT